MRPLLKLVAITVLSVFAALGAVALFFHLLGSARYENAKSEFTRRVGPVTPEAYAPVEIPDEENAALVIGAAVAKLDLRDSPVGRPNERNVVERCGNDGLADISDSDLATARAALERNGPVFDELARAIPLERSDWKIPYEQGYQAKFPNLLDGVRAAKAVACDGRIAVSDGAHERALRDARVLARMAASYEDEAYLILLMVGASVERLELDIVREILESPRTPSATIEALPAAILPIDLRERGRLALGSESAAFQRAMERGWSPEEGGVRFRILEEIFGELWLADHLRRTTILAEELDSPPQRREEIERQGQKRPFYVRFLPDTVAHTSGTVDRLLGTLTLRNLVGRALVERTEAMRAGAYRSQLTPPSTPSDDPLTAHPFTWTVLPGGGAILAAPAAEAESRSRPGPGRLVTWAVRLPEPS